MALALALALALAFDCTVAGKVWTFDCTVTGKSILQGRQFFEKLCIGDQPPQVGAAALPFARLEDIMRRLGHTQVTYLKMDIESSEFDVVERWQESDLHLPLQIALEVHKWRAKSSPERDSRNADVDMFMRHMAGLGYAVMIKEDNPGPDKCCAELLLVKVEQRVCHPALLGGLGGHPALTGGAGVGGAGGGFAGGGRAPSLMERLAAVEHALKVLQS